MAIARQGRSLTFTASNAGVTLTDREAIGSITFQGSGLTAAQRLVITDSATPGAGNILVDYLIEDATDNADLWGGRATQLVGALSIGNNTMAGTWVVTVSFL